MRTSYVELLTSLPHLPNPFRVERPPISAVQLRKRFRMLEADDQQLMQRLWDNVLWSSIPLQTEDAELVQRFQTLLQDVQDPLLQQWLCWRMDVRTLLSALRQRQAGAEAPAASLRWGLGELTWLIRRNWKLPAFGLQARLPWLPEAEKLLAAGQSLQLEKLVLQKVWQYYARCQPQPEFGFAAVFLYVSRWDICHRWTSYDHAGGLQQFDQLVANSLHQAGVNFEQWGRG